MALFQFSDGAAMFDSTPIENMFILEYLPYAPDGVARPYLYARMLALHPEMGEGLEDIARNLRMETESVENAFLYWERQGLMQKMSSNPPMYRILPIRSASAAEARESEEYYEYRNYTAALQGIFGAEELLHPQEYRMANDWLNSCGMTEDAVLYVVEREKRYSKAKHAAPIFQRANKKIVEMADKGAHTLEEVRRELMFDDDVRDLSKKVLKRLAISRDATEDELALVKKWMTDWNLGLREIQSACEETVRSRQPNFAYLDKILDNRQNERSGSFQVVKRALSELGAATTPTPEQRRRYEEWRAMGFEDETIVLAATQQNRRNRHTFADLENMLGKWSEMGLFALSAAKEYVEKNMALETEARRLLERAGVSKTPSMTDLDALRQLKGRFAAELIEYAADCAKGADRPMPYMKRLLEGWDKAGIRTAGEAAAQPRPQTFAPRKEPAKNPALDYEQRAYTDADYGEDFFFNPETQQYGGKKA